MWLFYRVLVLTAFLASVGQAHAQVTVTSTGNQPQSTLPQPTTAPDQIQTDNSMSAPQVPPALQVAPAQRIEPMLTPEEQAARMQSAQQAQQQQAAQQQQMAAQQQQQMTPNSQMPVMPQPQQIMQSPTGQVAAPPVQGGPAVIQSPPAQPAPATATATASTITPVTPAAIAGEKPLPPAEVSLQQGYSTADTPGTLPTATGMMPITNSGIDMNLQPNIVSAGGIDPPTATATGDMPYEVQLQQRTQELQQQARGMAFEQAKRSVLPMEPYEIRDVLARLKDTQEAIQTPVRPAPKPGNVIRTISTDPGVKPPTVHLAAGNVTTINLIDVTGEPWPIVDIGFGGPFDVKPPEAGGHVIRISPKKDFAHGNLVVRLLKVTTPVTFSLEAGGSTVDYRFDARLPEYGPNAKMPIVDDGIGTMAGDIVTSSFLEGVPPKGAEKVVVDGADGRTSAYRYSSSLYVRTPLSLLSPAWQGSATSSDGMNVYVLEDTPVLLLSDKGSLVRARLAEKTSSSTTSSIAKE